MYYVGTWLGRRSAVSLQVLDQTKFARRLTEYCPLERQRICAPDDSLRFSVFIIRKVDYGPAFTYDHGSDLTGLAGSKLRFLKSLYRASSLPSNTSV
jgi:hypothetical protein